MAAKKSLEELLRAGKPLDFSELRKQTGLTRKKIITGLNKLRAEGLNIKTYIDEQSYETMVYLPKGNVVTTEPFELHLTDGNYALAFTGDWHVGDKGFNEEALNKYFDACDDAGVSAMYHTGDIIAGVDVYRSQHVDLKIHTKMEQAEYVRDVLPKLSNGDVLFITGNHGLKNLEKSFDPGIIIGQRDGYVYLGQTARDVKLASGLELRLIHLKGRAYSRGYNIQKYLRELPPSEMPDILCFDRETELLTTKGWKKWYEIKEGDEIFNLKINFPKLRRNKHGQFLKKSKQKMKIVKDKVNKVIIKHVDEELVRIKGKFVDLLITENHRVLFKTSKYWMIKRAKELIGRKNILFMCSNIVDNKKQNISNELLELIGVIITDGHFMYHGKAHQKTVHNGIKIYQSEANKDKLKRIEFLLKKCGIEYSKYKKNFVGRTIGDTKYKTKYKHYEFYIHAKYGKIIKKLMDNNKTRIPQIIYRLNSEQFKCFLNGLILGDGHWAKEGISGRIWNSNKKLLDELQVLLTINGYRSKLSKHKNGYVIGFSLRQQVKIEKHKISTCHYKGPVWCVSTNNGTLIVRRNGIVSIQGNCRGHNHQLLYMIAQGVHCFETGTFQEGISNYVKERGLVGEIGGWIVELEILDGKLAKIKPELVLYE